MITQSGGEIKPIYGILQKVKRFRTYFFEQSSRKTFIPVVLEITTPTLDDATFSPPTPEMVPTDPIVIEVSGTIDEEILKEILRTVADNACPENTSCGATVIGTNDGPGETTQVAIAVNSEPENLQTVQENISDPESVGL